MDLVRGANILLPTASLLLEIQIFGIDPCALDFTAYCLSKMTHKVRGDDDMIFYGQLTNPSQSVRLEIGMKPIVYFYLDKIDIDVGKIAICATFDHAQHNFSNLDYLHIQIKDERQSIVAKAKILGLQRSERALIIGEVYRYKNQWKFRVVDQGFNGGLRPLSEHFGVEIADEPSQEPIRQERDHSARQDLFGHKKNILKDILETPFRLMEKHKNLKTFQDFIKQLKLKNHLSQDDKDKMKTFCAEKNIELKEAFDSAQAEIESFLLHAAKHHAKSELMDWCRFLHTSEQTTAKVLKVVDRTTENNLLRMLKKALSDGVLDEAELNELTDFMQKHDLNPNDMMAKAQADISNFFHFNLASFIDNESITPAEVRTINKMCNFLQPNTELLVEIKDTIKVVKKVEKIKKGNVDPIQTTEIIVKNSEIVYLQQKSVQIKISAKETLIGDLFITNLRIIFKSTKGIETLLSNIIAVEQISEYIEVIAKTKKGSGRFYVGQDAIIVNAYIDQAIKKFHRQLDLTQTSGHTRHIPITVKNSVWARCQGRCVQCTSTVHLEFDHIIPFSKGGSNSENNIQILCRACNLEKSNRI